MSWFTRTKEGYVDDLDWIDEAARKFQRILGSELDAEAIKTHVLHELPNARGAYMDREQMHWVLERRQGSSVDLCASKGTDPDNLKRQCWHGSVRGYERYAGLHLTITRSGEIAVAVKPLAGERLGPHAVRAGDALAKRIGFFDLNATR